MQKCWHRLNKGRKCQAPCRKYSLMYKNQYSVTRSHFQAYPIANMGPHPLTNCTERFWAYSSTGAECRLSHSSIKERDFMPKANMFK